MRLFHKICAGLLLLPCSSLWSQADNPSTQPVPAYGADTPVSSADVSDSRMLTPPPVSGQSYPSSFSGGERSNYLRGGLAFTSAYTDNAIGSITSKPVSDVSYS